MTGTVGAGRGAARAPEAGLRAADRRRRWSSDYAGAQAEHRVLTEDVRFLGRPTASASSASEREVVAGVRRGDRRGAPDLEQAARSPSR